MSHICIVFVFHDKGTKKNEERRMKNEEFS